MHYAKLSHRELKRKSFLNIRRDARESGLDLPANRVWERVCFLARLDITTGDNKNLREIAFLGLDYRFNSFPE